MADKEVDGHDLWRQFSEAGKMADQPYIPEGFVPREVHAGDGVALPAWQRREDGTFVTLEA